MLITKMPKLNWFIKEFSHYKNSDFVCRDSLHCLIKMLNPSAYYNIP